MHGKTRIALLGYGLPSNLIQKISGFKHTLGELRALNPQKLLEHHSREEIKQIKERINRAPIPEEVIHAVRTKTGDACCYCADGNSTRPFQIHHVDPYSETQNNSEDNLLACPTHHAAIHANGTNRSEQKSVRRGWQAVIEIASDFAGKGLTFPFGRFQAPDYESAPKPAELVEFAPLSPSTALICYPKELAATARTRLDSCSFLLILGSSGSGKSTYSMALGGLYAKDGFRVYRHDHGKQTNDSLQQVSLFISTCVRKTVIILDDANTWATASDLQSISSTARAHGFLRIIATWTSDDSDDNSRLHASDLCDRVAAQLRFSDRVGIARTTPPALELASFSG